MVHNPSDFQPELGGRAGGGTGVEASELRGPTVRRRWGWGPAGCMGFCPAARWAGGSVGPRSWGRAGLLRVVLSRVEP